MNCGQFESDLADYLDGTLSSSDRAAFEQHAAICPDCRELLNDARAGMNLLAMADDVEPPSELVTRIAYQAPQGKAMDPFAKESVVRQWSRKWLMPVLQPRLAMGMAMTILSFAMLKRCTGIELQKVQPSDLSPMHVWGGTEERAMRVKDRIVKYYENLKIVYEIESRLQDLQEQQPEKKAGQVGSKSQENGKDQGNRSQSQVRK